jgi:hypothetical protein
VAISTQVNWRATWGVIANEAKQFSEPAGGWIASSQ